MNNHGSAFFWIDIIQCLFSVNIYFIMTKREIAAFRSDTSNNANNGD